MHDNYFQLLPTWKKHCWQFVTWMIQTFWKQRSRIVQIIYLFFFKLANLIQTMGKYLNVSCTSMWHKFSLTFLIFSTGTHKSCAFIIFFFWLSDHYKRISENHKSSRKFSWTCNTTCVMGNTHLVHGRKVDIRKLLVSFKFKLSHLMQFISHEFLQFINHENVKDRQFLCI